MMKKNIAFMKNRVARRMLSACLWCFLCCCSLSAQTQTDGKVSKDDSLVFRKYLHIDMAPRTDVVLLQNIYYNIMQEYAMGISTPTMPTTYNSTTGKRQYYDVPTAVLMKKLEQQFEALHQDEAAFERGKQELIARLTAYNKEANEKPIFFADIETKYEGNIEKYVERLYSRSIMGNRKKFKHFVKNPRIWTIQEDPGFQFTLGLLLYEMALQGK